MFHQKLADLAGPTPREVRPQSPVVLYRPPTDLGSMEEFKKELKAINRHFVTVKNRMLVQGGDLIIGRYSMLPFYRELELDVAEKGAKLINTFQNHRYIADLQNWYHDLEGITPKTWMRLEDVPDNVGPVVLKGETNSRKEKWRTHMYAENKQEAVQVYIRLQDDGFLSGQSIYVREYVPLVKLQEGLGGQPITKEFRFFICDGKVLSGGYYWSSFVEDIGVVPKPEEVPLEFLRGVIDRVDGQARFYVVDVAQTVAGNWIVIELNDACQSGLSENDPEVLYKNLKDVLWNQFYQPRP